MEKLCNGFGLKRPMISGDIVLNLFNNLFWKWREEQNDIHVRKRFHESLHFTAFKI